MTVDIQRRSEVKQPFELKKQGLLGRLADLALVPIMQFLSGSLYERPQRTHFWNSQKLPVEYQERLLTELMVQVPGSQGAAKRWWLGFPLFHAPVFGGWKEYVVLEPWKPDIKWHVGWKTQKLLGVSKILVSGPVRVLVGSENVCFFGIDSEGNQCFIRAIGKGRVGDRSAYEKASML